MRTIFLLECTLYEEERVNLLAVVKSVYKDFEDLHRELKFKYIMSSNDNNIIWSLGFYTTMCFKKRRNTAIA